MKLPNKNMFGTCFLPYQANHTYKGFGYDGQVDRSWGDKCPNGSELFPAFPCMQEISNRTH